MSEIGKYWSVKNRGHLQPAHTVCMLCWSVVPRHFFLWWFRLYKDWQNCYDEKYHFLSTYQGQRQFTGFFFVSRHLSYQCNSWSYVKLFFSLLALCKGEGICWYNNASGSELESSSFAPCLVSNGLFRKLWPFAPLWKVCPASSLVADWGKGTVHKWTGIYLRHFLPSFYKNFLKSVNQISFLWGLREQQICHRAKLCVGESK